MVAVLGMVAGAKLVKSGSFLNGQKTSFTSSKYNGQQVEEIIKYLETQYVGEVSGDSLATKAINAMLAGLDPHTHYFPPDQMDELEERTMGHYIGIGIEIAFLNDSLVVLYPKKDSPASRAGIRPGDYIVAVNGLSIPQDTLDQMETLNLIKGLKGTKVSLTLKPMLSNTLRQVDVVRDEIKVSSVPAGYMIDTAIAYIKVDRFTNSTYQEFMDAWESLYTQHQARHLILDLRDNPGGYLKEAVNMLSQMINESDKLLVYTEGLHQRRVDYKSTGKVFFPFDHICVLINEGSASASEIVAGCIQDQDRGIVIGSTSYGKGLVQEQFDLSNGGKLRMTVSRYYTPSGRLIQKAYDASSAIDTLKNFKTALGRTVHAGGGIVPDVAVRDVVDWKRPEIRYWMDIISEYAIKYNLHSHNGDIVSVDKIQEIETSLPSRETIFNGMDELAKKRVSSSRLDSLLDFQKEKGRSTVPCSRNLPWLLTGRGRKDGIEPITNRIRL